MPLGCQYFVQSIQEWLRLTEDDRNSLMSNDLCKSELLFLVVLILFFFNIFLSTFRLLRSLHWRLHLLAVDQDCHVGKKSLFSLTSFGLVSSKIFKNQILIFVSVALGHLVQTVAQLGLVIITVTMRWTVPPACLMLETAVTIPLLAGTSTVDQPVLANVHNHFGSDQLLYFKICFCPNWVFVLKDHWNIINYICKWIMIYFFIISPFILFSCWSIFS